MTNTVIDVYREHIIHVYLYGMPLEEHYGYLSPTIHRSSLVHFIRSLPLSTNGHIWARTTCYISPASSPFPGVSNMDDDIPGHSTYISFPADDKSVGSTIPRSAESLTSGPAGPALASPHVGGYFTGAHNFLIEDSTFSCVIGSNHLPVKKQIKFAAETKASKKNFWAAKQAALGRQRPNPPIIPTSTSSSQYTNSRNPNAPLQGDWSF
ncbi:hypothetical protein P691DRAFT_776567 [Macrolepiota fuliginosa MF-IS2]|uniref:Uncharacterized protein n=1 Tax=Macrolepiota fuliginosa MF-IS2 TaxID=1400762 RepID=A0A9P5XBM4_9AGAR|nr:hypothetical protein P691DRAFT_776567 [Macrolepiota fuliginosa MF-IS2]